MTVSVKTVLRLSWDLLTIRPLVFCSSWLRWCQIISIESLLSFLAFVWHLCVLSPRLCHSLIHMIVVRQWTIHQQR